MKNNIYSAIKLYNFFDRYVSIVIYDNLSNTKNFKKI